MPWITAVARPEQPTVQARAGDRRWFEIRNATSDDTAEILIYDEIGGWYGWCADEFVEALADVSAPNLTVRINSPGGSVFEGIAIANALRSHPATVTVQVDGIAASIASVIALAGDRLVMMPHSQLMIHDASGLCIGNAADMAEMATLLDQQSDNLADVYAARAGGTREEWRARMQAETWYLAGEAVEAGLADEVAQPKRAASPTPVVPADPDEGYEPDMAARWDLSVFRYAGREQAPAPEPVATAEGIATALESEGTAPLTPAEPEPTAPEEPAAVVVSEETVDDWAVLTARFHQPEPDDWSSLTAHLIDPTLTPSSATTNA